MKNADQELIPIIILNWNGLEDTLECLASLDEQSWTSYKIYLLDNGSDERDISALQQRAGDDPRITLLLSPHNAGFTKGNNQILSQHILPNPAYRFVVLLNNDTSADKQWLEALVTSAREHGADMVASKMVNYYNPEVMDNAGHVILNTMEVLPLGRDARADRFTSDLDNAGPCAGAALYSVEMLREIGVFDPYFSNGYEDVELGLRGILCGYRSVFASDALVYHKMSTSIDKIRDESFAVNIQRSIFYYQGKLMPTGIQLLALPFRVLRAIVVVIINLLFGRWRLIRVQCLAVWQWLLFDRIRIKEARKEFYRSHTNISANRVLRRMRFFIPYDLKRMHRLLLKREKSVFERRTGS